MIYLQGERKVSVLVSFTIIFALHVVEVYWWYRNDGLINPLFMVPPKVIPPFWHAVFIVTVNGKIILTFVILIFLLVFIFFLFTMVFVNWGTFIFIFSYPL